MHRAHGVSFPLVLIIGTIISISLLTSVVLTRHFFSLLSPTITNTERLLKQGKLQDALSFSERLRSETTRELILKGQIWLALSLNKQKGENWSQYGTDSGNWLAGEESDMALRYFTDAVLRDPQSADAHYYLGVIYKEKGWLAEADREFDEVLELNSKYINALLGKGTVFVMMSRYSEAELVFREAYTLAPHEPSVVKNCAFFYRYYLLKPDSALLYLNRYLNLAGQRDLDVNLARQEFQNLLDRYPEYAPSEPQSWRTKKRQFISRNRD